MKIIINRNFKYIAKEIIKLILRVYYNFFRNENLAAT
jgi:hypothetical protein